MQDLRIFLFHRINPERDAMWDPMHPVLFERVLAHLARHSSIALAEEWVLSPTKQFRKPPVALVFDDGYQDFLDHALPVLKKFKLPASLYIVTESAEKGIPPWTYRLDIAFHRTRKTKVPPLAPHLLASLGPSFHECDWPNADARIAFGKRLKPRLKKIPNAHRLAIFEHFVQSFEDVAISEGLMMDWEGIRYAASEGVCVGSHTVTHPLLASIESETELLHELEHSHHVLKAQLGKPPITISYPIGSYDARVRAASQRAGYEMGLAVNQRPQPMPIADRFDVSRIELYNEPWLRTKLRTWPITYSVLKMLGRG